MGRNPLQKPGPAALLPKWKHEPGMLGILLTFQRDQTAMLQHADWVFPAAEKANVPIMFFAPDNIPRFAPIAERHPGLTLIIDHMGTTVEIAKEGRMKAAVDEVVKLAKFPNVSVKVSSTLL